MAGNLNKVQLIGRLGKDPEVRYTKDGTAVCTIRMATSETWKDKNGDKQERTEWHSVVLWQRLAEIAQQYLQKGRLVYIEGKLETRKWQDQNGQDRYTTEIRAFDMQMLDRGEGSGREAGPGPGPGPGPDRNGDRPPRGGTSGPRPATTADDDMGAPPDDDDIPF